MNIKKLFIGGIVGGVAFFLLGYLIYGLLLMDFMTNHPGEAGDFGRAEPLFMYLIIGNLAQGFLLSYVFIKSDVKSAAGGFVTGGIVGLLITVALDCIMYATTTIGSKTAMAADVVAATVMTAIVGVIIAIVMNIGKKSA